jgi:NhaA family Na+:H+ antiporter
MAKPTADQSKSDAQASILLLLAAAAALIAANTALSSPYQTFLSVPVEVRVGNFEIDKPLVLWINDGLMALFFFIVGLEIKSEILEGALSSRARALLPLIAALGGMAAPALIYAAVAWNDAQALRGWAIPTATDIAFAVGILGLLGPRLPPSLKTFLLALAVLDDLGAVIVIALFYTTDLSAVSLLFAAIFIAVLAAMNRLGVNRAAAYMLVGIALWTSVLKSGVHATLAGAVTAMFVPMRQADGSRGPLHALYDDLRWPVTFGVIPLFAFANAGVPLKGLGLGALTSTVTAGAALGLIVGKPVGIFAAVLAAVRLRLARLPEGMTLAHVAGLGCLGGIGFTMSLFIGTLAFDISSRMVEARLGVLAGSAVSAVLGIVVLGLLRRPVPRR